MTIMMVMIKCGAGRFTDFRRELNTWSFGGEWLS